MHRSREAGRFDNGESPVAAAMTNCRHLVFFIYNHGNRLIDTAFIDALESFDVVGAVVVIPGAKV